MRVTERIRALGTKAPGSFSEFKELISIREETVTLGADVMASQPLSNHTIASATALQVVTVAESRGDATTADFAIWRVAQHEKTGWMLDSLLQRSKQRRVGETSWQYKRETLAADFGTDGRLPSGSQD